MSNLTPGQPDHRADTAGTAIATLLSSDGILRRYGAALLPGIVILLGAVQAATADGTVTEQEGGQLFALVAGLVVTYLVPLAPGRWAGAFKTGAAILAAVATLIIPLVTGFSGSALLLFVMAALTALATHVGVKIRTDEPAAVPA